MLLAARQPQQTEAFRALYRLRGVRETFCQTTRNTGVRRARYRGLPTTHLQHILSAVATNLLRLNEWLNGTPFAQTRTSRFATFAAWSLVRQQYRTDVNQTRQGGYSWSAAPE